MHGNMLNIHYLLLELSLQSIVLKDMAAIFFDTVNGNCWCLLYIGL